MTEGGDIRRTEDHLRLLNEILCHSPVVAFVWENAEGWPVRYVSENVAGLFGYTAEEFTSGQVPFAEVIDSRDLDRVGQEVAESSANPAAETIAHTPYRIVTKAGVSKWVEDMTTIRRGPDGRAETYLGILRDISGRMATEAKLLESQRILNATGTIGKIGGWEHDLRTRKAVWTDALYDMVELPRDSEPPGVDEHLDYYSSPHRERLGEAYRAAIEQGEPFSLELQAHTATGRPIWCRAQGEPVFENGECVALRGTFQDITDRKEAEFAAEEARERLEMALRSGNVGLYDWRAGEDRLYLSPQWKRQLGYEPDDLSDDMAMVLHQIHPDDRAGVASFLNEYAAGRRGEYRIELRMQHRDGSFRHILSCGEAVDWPDAESVRMLGCNIDITERVQLDQQLRQAQKMEGIGKLAGGVAHDFNNILTGMKGYIDFVLKEVPPDSRAREDMLEVEALADRAAELTRQLLAFSRKQMLAPVAVDVNDLIAEQIRMLRRLLGENIEIRFTPEEHLRFVMADSMQLQQVLMNLAVNARDAMPRGGRLVISTENVVLLEQDCATLEGIRPGPHVLISVTDTGCGMSEAVAERIFEPFFTTKGVGEGTGLGLSTAYGIIRQHGGDILVVSQPDKGTTFNVYLPVPEGRPEEPAAERQDNGTALLAEDEEPVRNVAARFLEDMGFAVISAANAEEAEAKADAHDGRIDLLVTDVAMPGRSGHELYDSLSRKRGGLKVLYMSGYAPEEQGRGGPLLPKPFEWHAFVAAVHQVLKA